jgi:sugar phosphate isomerase/epimerase
MLNRRNLLKNLGATGIATMLPAEVLALTTQKKTKFRFCLNTSTISGQKLGIVKYIEIAAAAGYDGIEIWLPDLNTYLKEGGTMTALAQRVKDAGITVEDAIAFAPWMVEDDAQRAGGFKQLEEEMNLLAQLGCKRIAAPPAGVKKDPPLDLFKAGERYKQALDLGRKTGVMPQLEFWGASGTLFHLGQALAVAAAANDPDARLLPDVYHLFRGGSGFDGLRLLKGSAVEIFHFNDFVNSKPVAEQTDADRIYPGDGDAPLDTIVQLLKEMGGTKVISLELFNRDYWKQDPLLVAKTGLQKLQTLV